MNVVSLHNPYIAYYRGQAGGTLSVFRGSQTQRGYGIGGFFASLFRRALPLITRGAKVVGKELVRTGVKVASDVMEGQDIKDSAKKRFIHTGEKLAGKLVDHVRAQSGGRKRRRSIKAQSGGIRRKALAEIDFFGPPCIKRGRLDYLGG
jgi:hypothetical protein